jgi:hypothetical protein
MNCDGQCACDELCYIAGCIMKHELIRDDLNIKSQILQTPTSQRPKFIISVLEAKRPPKVSQHLADQYFEIKKSTRRDPDKRKKK